MKKYLRNYWPIFVLPTFLAFAVFFVAPFVMGLYLSLTEFTTISNTTFVGINNYIRAFQDDSFVHSFLYTLAFAIVTVVLVNVVGFAIALALTGNIPGRNGFRTVFFLPNLIGGIVLGYVWQIILNGILAYYQTTLNLDERLGFIGLVIVVCWQQIGYMMIIYVAGLQAVSNDVLEAATIDGANYWQKLTKVIIPTVMPSITIATFLTLSNSFKLFDQNLSLTAGEPGGMSEMLALNIYSTFYGRVGWEGVGQAKAVIFTVVVTAISLLQLRATSSKEVQQ